jgi:hypothetical protein
MLDDPVIHSLCLQQMAPWLGATIDRQGVEEVYHSLNTSVRSIFLLRISSTGVELLEKPGFRLREAFNDSSQPEPEGPVIFREEFIRARMYRRFFERCLAGHTLASDILIAVDVNDAPISNAAAPVFAFQKPAGSNTVLIPDVDFLHANFYIPPDYRDDIPYHAKLDRAIFAGSTTGGRTITARDVLDLAIPRLRAGVFFKGSDKVDFRIPRIVQCENAAVAEMISALGINNLHCSWPEQFRHRFILSMDGNGATCSRVVIALSSQAALVKYDSPCLLYYFGALLPWEHYIPVASDAEVESVVNAERRHPMIFANIAKAGTAFARRYLGREGVCAYTAKLLRLYTSCLSGADDGGGYSVTGPPIGRLSVIEFGAHVSGVGDVWAWPGEWIGDPGSGRAIEAIAMVPTGIPNGAITCEVMFRDGSLNPAPGGGYFYGTRGKDKPLFGFLLRIGYNWPGNLTCLYTGRFTDGSIVGPLIPGEICKSSSGASLEAFEIVVAEAD